MPSEFAAAGLPRYIARLAEGLHSQGHEAPCAVAMAASQVKTWAKDGTLESGSRAQAAVAASQWERARKGREPGSLLAAADRFRGLTPTPAERAALAVSFDSRRTLLEGLVPGDDVRAGSVAAAHDLLEGRAATLRIDSRRAAPHEVARVRLEVDRETALLHELASLLEGARGTKHKAPAPPKPPKMAAAKVKPLPADADSARVGHLQARLSSLGHQLKVDGHYGPETHAAVLQFQAGHGLTVDGEVGEVTTQALQNPEAAKEQGNPAPSQSQEPIPGPEESDDSTLYKGLGVGERSGHSGVKQVQQQLKDLDYDVDCDGRFGPETDATIRDFQDNYGLKADGIVGDKTHRTLTNLHKRARQRAEAESELAEATDGGDIIRLRARIRAIDRLLEGGDIQEAKDSLAKASTPEPFSKSKTSNWVARNGGLPAYIQHVAHGIMRSGEADESAAIRKAIGVVKNWASGQGNVDANTRAAAAKAIAQWEAMKARNKAKKVAESALEESVNVKGFVRHGKRGKLENVGGYSREDALGLATRGTHPHSPFSRSLNHFESLTSSGEHHSPSAPDRANRIVGHIRRASPEELAGLSSVQRATAHRAIGMSGASARNQAAAKERLAVPDGSKPLPASDPREKDFQARTAAARRYAEEQERVHGKYEDEDDTPKAPKSPGSGRSEKHFKKLYASITYGGMDHDEKENLSPEGDVEGRRSSVAVQLESVTPDEARGLSHETLRNLWYGALSGSRHSEGKANIKKELEMRIKKGQIKGQKPALYEAKVAKLRQARTQLEEATTGSQIVTLRARVRVLERELEEAQVKGYAKQMGGKVVWVKPHDRKEIERVLRYMRGTSSSSLPKADQSTLAKMASPHAGGVLTHRGTGNLNKAILSGQNNGTYKLDRPLDLSAQQGGLSAYGDYSLEVEVPKGMPTVDLNKVETEINQGRGGGGKTSGFTNEMAHTLLPSTELEIIHRKGNTLRVRAKYPKGDPKALAEALGISEASWL